jgi:hypothetical protein
MEIELISSLSMPWGIFFIPKQVRKGPLEVLFNPTSLIE